MTNITRRFSFVPIFSDLEKEFNRIFNANFDLPAIEASDWQPWVDIIEEDDKFIVKADIPGVDPKDISINFDNNTLTIKGEKESEHKDKKENFIRYERSKGTFCRRIVLPEMIDANKITAEGDKNGVLVITIPRSEKHAIQKIEVQSS